MNIYTKTANLTCRQPGGDVLLNWLGGMNIYTKTANLTCRQPGGDVLLNWLGGMNIHKKTVNVTSRQSGGNVLLNWLDGMNIHMKTANLTCRQPGGNADESVAMCLNMSSYRTQDIYNCNYERFEQFRTCCLVKYTIVHLIVSNWNKSIWKRNFNQCAT